MDCKRAEELMPRDAGGDLEDGRARAGLSAHLGDCAPCRRLAAEWAESRALLRLHEPPEFDAAFFEHVRRNVMREITTPTTAAPAPTVFAALLALLPRARTLAYAASLALVFAALLFGLRLSRAPQPTKVAGGGVASSVNEALAKEINPPRPTPRIVVREQAHRKTRAFKTVPRADRPAPTRAAALPDAAALSSLPDAAAELAVVRDEREMLKIELQTRDPNVRIIWFSPQPSEQTSPRRSNDQR
ncbi:MAG TPA: hypothetical protein VF064_19780 [Pyrinomonadaceae bacterium]